LTQITVQHLPIKGSSFDCTLEDDVGCRLRQYYEIALDSPEYELIGAPLSIFGALGYVCGIPALYLGSLWRKWAHINPPRHEESERAWIERRDKEVALPLTSSPNGSPVWAGQCEQMHL